MKDQIGRNVYAYLMSYWEDLDDHLGRLEPNDLNLDYVGISHLDCVSRVECSTTALCYMPFFSDFFDNFYEQNSNLQLI